MLRLSRVVAWLTIAGCGRVSFDLGNDASVDAGIDAPAGPSLVQSSGASSASAMTLSASLSAPPTIGDVLVLVGAGTIGSIQTPTGGTSMWTRAASSLFNSNVEIWFGVADGASSTISISIGSLTGMSLWVGEWSGLATTNTLDTARGGTGTSSPATAGAITTTTPAVVIFAVGSFQPNTFGTPTDGSWTELDRRSGESIYTVWYELATTPRVIAPTVTETRHSWDAAIAAFRTSP